MRYLVLGGAGFIGQHLVHTLLKSRQNRVTVIDNLRTASFNSADFAQYKNLFDFIEMDLTNADDAALLKIFKKHDKIFHLAGAVGVDHVDKNPKYTMFNNVQLALKLCPLFEQAGKHVVFASTSEVYGNGPTFRETDTTGIGSSDKARWAYSTAKLMTEFMIRASCKDYTIVRFFNVVGPGQLSEFGMVLPKFIKAAKSGQPLLVHGDGQQVRAFCHIADAIDALIKVSNISGELFNIGNDDTPITMERLAHEVVDVLQSSSEIKLIPYDQVFSDQFEDIRYRVPNLDKLKAAINHKPKYNLTQIIKDTA